MLFGCEIAQFADFDAAGIHLLSVAASLFTDEREAHSRRQAWAARWNSRSRIA
jgi:hypothetical protein